MPQEALPKELLRVLPSDALECLLVGNQIGVHAFTTRLAHLETENKLLRKTFAYEHDQIQIWEQKVIDVETRLIKTHYELQLKTAEVEKLILEKNANALTNEVKKLHRGTSKAECFEAYLIESLHNTSYSTSFPAPAASTPAYSPPKTPKPTSFPATAASTPAYSPPKTPDRRCSFSGQKTGQRSSFSGYSAARHRVLIRSSIGHLQGSQRGSPPTSQETASISSAPPSGRPDKMKEFFRRVRERLPRQECSQFLDIIKELKAHQKTLEETLETAADLFKPENTDLYKAFASMVYRWSMLYRHPEARRATY